MTHVVVAAVIKEDDKYLLTKRAKLDKEDDPSYMGKWELPGGGLEFGEGVEDCLHREVKEELGIEVDVHTLVSKVYHTVRDDWHGVFICYLCTKAYEDDEIVLNEECSEYGWFTLEEVEKLETLPHVREVVEESDSIFLM